MVVVAVLGSLDTTSMIALCAIVFVGMPHGAMDGASKFVRGDAVAGILITIVNIIGGFAIGVLQRDLSLAEALQTYTLLTVGDGLVTQIPALITSTAAGIIVTRATSDGNMGSDINLSLIHI